MYFFEKYDLSFSVLRIRLCFRGKGISSYLITQERSYPSATFLERPSFQTICRKYHISMDLFQKDHLSFSVQRISSYIREKEISSLLIIQGRSYPRANFLERSSYQTICRKYHISMYFFNKGCPSFFVQKIRPYFQEKRNIILLDNTRKVIFQCDFFWKTIFSEHLHKEDMAFSAVLVHLIC